MSVLAQEATMPVEEIEIGERVRKDLGDIAALADSISREGLLHPPVVTPDGALVCGRRRIAAWVEAFPGEPIPVRTVAKADALDALHAERDENTCRKDFTPTEQIAMGKKIEAVHAPAALERKVEGGAKGGRAKHVIGRSHASPDKTRKVAADTLGLSEGTYTRLKRVDAATAHPDASVAKVARQALVDLDTGEITPNKAADLVREAQSAAQASPVAQSGPRRVRKGGRTHAQAVEAIAQQMQGIASATTSLADLDPQIPADDLRQWASDIKKSLTQLSRFQRQLATAAEGTES